LLYNNDEEEYKKAMAHFKQLLSSGSPLMQGGGETQITRTRFTKWRDILSARCHDVLEYRRLANEVKSAETKVGELEEKLLDSCRQLQNDKASAEDLVEEVDKLRSLLDSANHWADDSRKIAAKRAQVKEKEIDFSMSTGVDTRGRDLQTLQREMEERQEQREHLNTKVRGIMLAHYLAAYLFSHFRLQVGRLNKELSAFMTRISHVNGQVSVVQHCSTAGENTCFAYSHWYHPSCRRNGPISFGRKRKRSTKKWRPNSIKRRI
jgi:chromosome segregation ATPase